MRESAHWSGSNKDISLLFLMFEKHLVTKLLLEFPGLGVETDERGVRK